MRSKATRKARAGRPPQCGARRARRRLHSVLAAALALLGPTPAIQAEEAPSLRFLEGDAGAFRFDTGVLSGELRREGRSTGLVPVTHKASGTTVASGEGLFNHYRVFTRGKRYGYGARRWPSTAQLRADGSVEVLWPETPERPFALRAHYHWVAPNTLDLVTEVHAKQELEAFEVFLASYLDSAFVDSRVWASHQPGGGAAAGFVAADRALGEWLSFPRDGAATQLISDGRWALEPHPLDWVLMPSFEHPVAVRRAPASGLTVVAMSRQEDCFGVFTPYGEEKHISNYFSLFGKDLQPGESARALARLVVLPDWSEAKLRGIYEVFRKVRLPPQSGN